MAILDADKEGFLRSKQALIQTVGRAARHEEGHVIMYADRITGSMKAAMDEVTRRRKVQMDYNTKHGITPQGIQKAIKESRLAGMKQHIEVDKETGKAFEEYSTGRCPCVRTKEDAWYPHAVSSTTWCSRM